MGRLLPIYQRLFISYLYLLWTDDVEDILAISIELSRVQVVYLLYTVFLYNKYNQKHFVLLKKAIVIIIIYNRKTIYLLKDIYMEELSEPATYLQKGYLRDQSQRSTEFGVQYKGFLSTYLEE